MPRKPAHSMPSVSLQPTARATLPIEWSAAAYSHPEGDGQFYIDLNCRGMDVTICLDDFDQLKAVQKAVNEAVDEEEELRK